MSQNGANEALKTILRTHRPACMRGFQKSLRTISIKRNRSGTTTQAIDNKVYRERVVRAPTPNTSSECRLSILRYSLSMATAHLKSYLLNREYLTVYIYPLERLLSSSFLRSQFVLIRMRLLGTFSKTGKISTYGAPLFL